MANWNLVTLIDSCASIYRMSCEVPPSKQRLGSQQTHVVFSCDVVAFPTWTCTLGQVKFPNFSRTPPQNLQMVNLVWVNAKKTDLKASNQPRFGHLHFFRVKLQYKTKKLISPNLIIPFCYNLLILVVEHTYIVCPTTFIAISLKFRGTSVYWPWL